MLDQVPGAPALLAVIAVLPSCLSWWWGRGLIRQIDDPALPERLVATQKRRGFASAAAVTLLIVASPPAMPWTLTLLVVANIAAHLPLRKALFGETWSLGQYLSFCGRAMLALVGFWLALALLPTIVRLGGSLDWLLAIVVSVVLLGWNARFASLVRRLIRSTPLEDPALLARFTRMTDQCGLPATRFEQIDLRGGAVANAIALPSLRNPAVLFTNTLLARLDPDEVVAICAHEVAHLEYYDAAHLRRLNLVTLGLIVTGAAAAPIARIVGASFLLTSVVWAAALVAVLAWRARDKQRQETLSDQRAVALTGDAETLVRALTKIYTFARLPRRFDVDQEQRATHPSLARRIRDIRKAAGASPAALAAAASFTAPDGRVSVRFDSDRLHWTEGPAAVHTLSYAYLTELRLQARHSGPPCLVALEAGGRRWEMSLAEQDVAGVQSVLDVVDGQLADPPATRRAWPQAGRVLIAFVAVLALALGQIAVALVSALAWLRPASPVVAGAGVAAVTAAALTVRSAPGGSGEYMLFVALPLAILGAILLGVSRTTGREPAPQQIALPLIALAIGATFACCALMVNATSVVRLHQSARALPSAVVLLTALAATLACSRIPAKQYASLAVAAAALAAAAIGSTAFLDRFGRDPFLVRAEAMEWRTLSDRPESEFAIPFPVSHLRLSPSGRHVAVVPVDRTMGADEPMPFHVGPAGGDLTPIEADDLIFLDDERALVLQSTPEGAELRVMRTGESRDVEWRQRVPGIVGSSLAFRESTKKWRLLGWDRSHGLVRVEGHVGREGLEWTRWAASEVHNGWIDAIAASGPSALVVETRYDPGLLTGTTAWAWGLLIPQQIMESRFWTLAAGGRSDHGTSRLETHCIGATMDDERLVCSAFDGTDTRLIALDPGTGAVSPLGSLPGRFAGATLTGAGWLTGWADSTVVALHPATRQALRVTGRQGYVASMAVTSQVIGTAAYDRGATMTVRLYGIEQVRRKPRATPQGRSAQNLGTQ